MKESEFNIKLRVDNEYIVYNALTGALLRLQEDESLLNRNDVCEIDDLKTNGFIIEDNIDEFNMIQYQRQLCIWNKNEKMIRFSIALTMECQAKCPYCFEKDALSSKRMTSEKADQVCAFLRDSLIRSKAKRLHITFYGGEPLLNTEAMLYIGKQMKAYCEKNDITFTTSMMTNGMLLDGDSAKAYASELNMVRSQITLDGTRDVHNRIKGMDCFDRVIKNIKDSSKSFKIYVRLNVSSDNISDMDNLIGQLGKYFVDEKNIKVYLARIRDDLRVKSATANSLTVAEFNNYVMKIYENRSLTFLEGQAPPPVARTHCSFEGIYNFCIDPDGYLYKCEHDVGNSDYAVGDVCSGEYYNEREMRFYRNYDGKCITTRCAYLPICSGGCMMERNKDIVAKCTDTREAINNSIIHFYRERRKGKWR